MARTRRQAAEPVKERTCKRCGGTFPETAEHFYIYKGRTPIHKACEIARSGRSHKATAERRKAEAAAAAKAAKPRRQRRAVAAS